MLDRKKTIKQTKLDKKEMKKKCPNKTGIAQNIKKMFWLSDRVMLDEVSNITRNTIEMQVWRMDII